MRARLQPRMHPAAQAAQNSGEYISVFLLAGSLGDVIMKLFFAVSGLEDGARVDAMRSFSRATALLEEE